MSRFGECQGYTGEACAKCGRVRVERYSNGFEVCEKCRWCPQLGYCVPDDEYYDDDCEDAFALARNDDRNKIVEQCIDAIRGLKVHDSKERKKGKWIRNTNGRGGHECNQCNEYAPSTRCGTERLSPYCPNCGVKMEVDE